MKGKPFALIGINSDGAREALKKRLDKEGIVWRQAIDGSTHGPIATEWGVHGWPTVYVLDEKGVIRATNARGELLDRNVELLVSALEKAAPPEK